MTAESGKHPPRSHSTLVRLAAPLLLAAIASACSESSGFGPAIPPDLSLDIELVDIAVGLESPVYVTSPPADPRLFVVEQPGRIRVIVDGTLRAEPFLDITDRVRFGGEQGLLGLAFDPDFRASGRVFVNYTDLDGHTRVEAFLTQDEGDRADPRTGMLFLEVEQPFPNHNGGQLAFGPDGMLYIGLGDGGSGGDPGGHGQDPSSLLGTILRVDVLDQREPPYRIPNDNPFIGDAQIRPEVWQYGLRNPWRFSFDPDRNWMIVPDVGQDRWEEVNVTPIGQGGANFGWNVMEGSQCFGGADCNAEGLTLPVAVYGHGDGCSITGGYVYRGSDIPGLVGRYVYSDYCASWLRTFEITGSGQARDPFELVIPEPLPRVTSMGRDAQNELYLTTVDGRVLRLAPRS